MSRGCDAARFLKIMLELLVGTGDIDIEKRIRNGNTSVVEHARSINSAAEARRSNGFLESNRDGLGTNPWVASSHIMRPLNIPGDMDKQRRIVN